MHRNISILAIILTLLIAGDALFAWTAPGAVPPASNVAAPLHSGATGQVKSGGLSLNTLQVMGQSTVGWDPTPEANLLLDVNGRVGASEYCDQNGLNCTSALGGGGGGVSLTGGLGITLSPTTITNTGTISANTTYLQRRVSGVCPVNQAIRTINADGTVVCQALPANMPCLHKGLQYSTGYTCRTGVSSCGTGQSYGYMACQANGTWSVYSGGCTLSTSNTASCP